MEQSRATWMIWGDSLLKLSILNFHLLLDITPHQKVESLVLPDHVPHIGKKVSIIPFQQTLPKVLPAACIFSYTRVNPLIQNNVPHDFRPEQYLRFPNTCVE